jgi:hypothetical protein
MRHLHSFVGSNHTQLLPFITNQPDFLATNTVIDTQFFKYVFPFLPINKNSTD